MPTYKQIRSWADLPSEPPKRAQESYELDFKSEHKKDGSEQAKDMAAFANARGGVVLIGVAESADNYERRLLEVVYRASDFELANSALKHGRSRAAPAARDSLFGLMDRPRHRDVLASPLVRQL